MRRLPAPLRVLAATVLAVGTAAVVWADDPEAIQPPTNATPQPTSHPDFWFGRPRGSVGVQGGWLFARTQSDLFDFVRETLTIEKRDLDTPLIGATAGIAVSPRMDVLIGFDFSRAGTSSEYRRLVDNNRLPIEQTTHLRDMNLSGTLRFALLRPGREVTRLVWVQRTMTPYVGAGAGIIWYKFEQEGDFVDFVDNTVFTTALRSSGWGPSAHVLAGVDINVWRHMFLTTEARYRWSHAEVGGDYSGFQSIDLTGAKITAGIRYAF